MRLGRPKSPGLVARFFLPPVVSSNPPPACQTASAVGCLRASAAVSPGRLSGCTDSAGGAKPGILRAGAKITSVFRYMGSMVVPFGEPKLFGVMRKLPHLRGGDLDAGLVGLRTRCARRSPVAVRVVRRYFMVHVERAARPVLASRRRWDSTSKAVGHGHAQAVFQVELRGAPGPRHLASGACATTSRCSTGVWSATVAPRVGCRRGSVVVVHGAGATRPVDAPVFQRSQLAMCWRSSRIRIRRHGATWVAEEPRRLRLSTSSGSPASGASSTSGVFFYARRPCAHQRRRSTTTVDRARAESASRPANRGSAGRSPPASGRRGRTSPGVARFFLPPVVCQ